MTVFVSLSFKTAAFPALFPRGNRWSEAAADIRALQEDGKGWSAQHRGKILGRSSYTVLTNSMVKNDDQGSCRLIKADGTNNKSQRRRKRGFNFGSGSAGKGT